MYYNEMGPRGTYFNIGGQMFRQDSRTLEQVKIHLYLGLIQAIRGYIIMKWVPGGLISIYGHVMCVHCTTVLNFIKNFQDV